jgi:hypothetical protein
MGRLKGELRMACKLVALLLLSASVAGAQEVMAPRVVTSRDARPHIAATGPTTQGSMWIDSGGSSPLEKDFATRFFAEEGVVVNAVGPFDLGAYVNTTDSVDQHSLDWNRFMRGSGGVKLVKPFILGGFGGLVRADLGYSVEHRFVSDRTAASPAAVGVLRPSISVPLNSTTRCSWTMSNRALLRGKSRTTAPIGARPT